jgi:hypothetical protein
MPYDAKKVERLLGEMQDLRDDRSDETKAAFDKDVRTLTQADKYEVGAAIIMKIAGYAATLAQHEKYINGRQVRRSDLQSKGGTGLVFEGCTKFLDSLGFIFAPGMSGKILMDGDVGWQVRTNFQNKENLCQLFLGKLQPGNSIFAWTDALYNGFVIDKAVVDQMVGSQRQELKKVSGTMRQAADGIWSCVRDFMALKIKIDD